MKKYDFRIHGKKRINSIIISNYNIKQNQSFFDKLLKIIQKSRKIKSVIEKIELINTKKSKRTKKRKSNKKRNKLKYN